LQRKLTEIAVFIHEPVSFKHLDQTTVCIQWGLLTRFESPFYAVFSHPGLVQRPHNGCFPMKFLLLRSPIRSRRPDKGRNCTADDLEWPSKVV